MANVHRITNHDTNQHASVGTGQGIVGRYVIENDAIISIPAGSALDYAQMRASQLYALNAMMVEETFEHFSDDIKQHAHWLASTLSDEVKALMQVVRDDTIRGT